MRKYYRLFFTLAFLVVLGTVSGAESKQEEGQQLIARAVELSNIRAAGAPAFRMKASFRAVATPAAGQGTYSEIWISREQWRRETEVGGFRRVEVGGPKKKWLLDSRKDIPLGAASVASLLSLGSTLKLKVKAVANKDIWGVAARCVESETEFAKELYCVDPKDNTLLLHETRSRVSPSVHLSYVYRDYERFGDRLFPRSIQYSKEGQAGVEINISELLREPSADDPSQFAPLSGGVETSNCLLSDMTPPREEARPEPTFPKGERANRALVILWAIVGTDGLPHNIRVANSGGAAFDTEAVRAVARWRFRPSTCRGEPVAATINIELDFRR